jgi:hypothetical protein
MHLKEIYNVCAIVTMFNPTYFLFLYLFKYFRYLFAHNCTYT